jgi:pilus assembly protein CpaC
MYGASPYGPAVLDPQATILLHMSIIKVSLTKLHAQGVDFDEFLADETPDSAEGKPKAKKADDDLFGDPSPEKQGYVLLNQEDKYFVKIKKLVKGGTAIIVAQPKLTTLNGRPASFNAGGEIPVPVQGNQGTTTIEWKNYGTNVVFVPNVMNPDTIRLEIRATLSKLDSDNSVHLDKVAIPGIRSNSIDTACKMKIGQVAVFTGGRESSWLEDSGDTAGMEKPNETDAKPAVPKKTAEETVLLLLIKPEIVETKQ